MRKIGEFLLAKDFHAAIAAFLCTLLPLIGLPGAILTAIVVGLVTLHKGYKSGLFVLAWVALPAISLLYLHRVGVFDMLLVRCVLVWCFAALLRSYRSWRLVLEVAAIIGFIAIMVLHIVMPDIHSWWHTQITAYFNEISKATTWRLSAEETQLLIKRLVPIATGIVSFFVLVGTIVPLLIARWWQSYLYNPKGLQKEFVRIRMGSPVAIILVVVLIAAAFKLALAIDFLPVLLLPFMMAGISLMHKMIERKKSLLLLVIMIYLGLLFLPFFVIVMLALIGFVDSWFDFRKRFVAAPRTK